MNGDPLGLDPETMRRLGYRTVDMLVDRLSDPSIPPLRRASPEEMARRLSGPPPAGPEPLEQILARLETDVLPFMSRTGHPAFFAFIPSNGTWPSALGDFVASACNVYAGSWMEAAGPSQVELEVVRWFADWIGYPETAGGELTTGGSAANMTALACAREWWIGPMSDRLVVYVSDQAHSSLARAARVLGFRPEQVRVLPADSSFRMRPSRLAAAMDADVRAGRQPLFVAANAGATNTGAIDPLPELAELCREREVWLHADAAYGGFAILTERGREALAGLELADSITLDPHKWLYQPYECGSLLVREGEGLQRAFAVTPDYLKDAETHGEGVNFADLGLQLTRSSRALKVWMSLRYFGLDAFRQAIDRSLDVAALARERIEASGAFELMAPPSLGIVCFRRVFADTDDEEEVARRNARLVAALADSGIALVSSTRLHGRYAIRLCVLNHTSGAEHVERAIEFLERTEVAHGPDAPLPRGYAARRDGSRRWVAQVPSDAHPLFEGLEPEELDRVLALAEEREVDPGETILEQWEVSRDFFVILEGTADVLVDGALVDELEAGDFFGELAALDWVAGFGYPRTATVVARTPLRLLVFPEGRLNGLVAELESVGALVQAAVRQRLPR